MLYLSSLKTFDFLCMFILMESLFIYLLKVSSLGSTLLALIIGCFILQMHAFIHNAHYLNARMLKIYHLVDLDLHQFIHCTSLLCFYYSIIVLYCITLCRCITSVSNELYIIIANDRQLRICINLENVAKVEQLSIYLC